MYGDYRKMLEKEKPHIVTIGTPDHWHVPIAIAALQAGCDVYCEKPLTLTIDEGIRIRDAVKETGRVFQVGTQQRSEYDLLFLKAIAIVQERPARQEGERPRRDRRRHGRRPVSRPRRRPPASNWDYVGRPGQQGRLLARAPQGVPLVLRLLRRQDDRLGRPPHRHRPMGPRPRPIGPGEGHAAPASSRRIVPEKFDWLAYFAGKATLPNGYQTATKFDIKLEYADGSTITLQRQLRRRGRQDEVRERHPVRGRRGPHLRQPREAHRQAGRGDDRRPTRTSSTSR